MLALKIMQL